MFSASSLDALVHIKGRGLSAKEVIAQLVKQTGLRISADVDDKAQLKKNYDHKTTAQKVLQAFVEYHREHNNLDLNIIDRGHGQIRIAPKEKKTKIASKKEKPNKKVILRNRKANKSDKKEGVIVGLVLPSNPKSTRSKRRSYVKQQKVEKKEIKKNIEKKKTPPIVEAAKKRSEVAKTQAKDDIEVLDLIGLKKTKKSSNQIESTKPKRTASLNGKEKKLSRPTLKVEIVRDTRMLSQTGVPLSLDLFESVSKTNQETSNEQHSLMDRIKAIDHEESNRFLKLNFSDFVSNDYSGVQAGFLFPQIIPSKILVKNRKSITVGLAAQQTKVDGGLKSLESIDTTSYQLRGQYKIGIMKNLEGLLELRGSMHSGDFMVAGAGNRSLNPSLGDSIVGLNGLVYEDEKHHYRILSGLRIKLPTGSKSNFTGTKNIDGGLYVAGYHTVDRFLQFLQIGISKYGDHEALQSLDIQNSINAMLGGSYDISDALNVYGTVVYTENPFDASGRADFYEDDILLLNLGLISKTDLDAIGVNLHIGTTDSSADVGIQFSWNKFFD